MLTLNSKIPPQMEVSARTNEREYLLSKMDNGSHIRTRKHLCYFREVVVSWHYAPEFWNYHTFITLQFQWWFLKAERGNILGTRRAKKLTVHVQTNCCRRWGSEDSVQVVKGTDTKKWCWPRSITTFFFLHERASLASARIYIATLGMLNNLDAHRGISDGFFFFEHLVPISQLLLKVPLRNMRSKLTSVWRTVWVVLQILAWPLISCTGQSNL